MEYYRKKILPNEDCFYIEDRYIDRFDFPIPRYFEYELSLVINATGASRIVGSSIETIGEYDLVLIRNRDLEYNLEQYNSNQHIRRISIQFSPDIFGNLLHNAFSSIAKMFNKAWKGLCFSMNNSENISSNSLMEHWKPINLKMERLISIY